MSPNAAAVFAQVIPMLFIATFLQYRRFKRFAPVEMFMLLAVGSTIASELFLLIAVAKEEPPIVGIEAFIWFAVAFHLVMIAAVSLHHYLSDDNDPNEKPDEN